jgi:hypothetical protein
MEQHDIFWGFFLTQSVMDVILSSELLQHVACLLPLSAAARFDACCHAMRLDNKSWMRLIESCAPRLPKPHTVWTFLRLTTHDSSIPNKDTIFTVGRGILQTPRMHEMMVELLYYFAIDYLDQFLKTLRQCIGILNSVNSSNGGCYFYVTCPYRVDIKLKDLNFGLVMFDLPELCVCSDEWRIMVDFLKCHRLLHVGYDRDPVTPCSLFHILHTANDSSEIFQHCFGSQRPHEKDILTEICFLE